MARAAWLFALGLAACGTDPGPGDALCAPCDAGGSDTGVVHVREVVAIGVVPDSATLRSIDGSMPTQTFVVIAQLADGTTVPVDDATWTTDFVSLGEVVPGTGDFHASGYVG